MRTCRHNPAMSTVGEKERNASGRHAPACVGRSEHRKIKRTRAEAADKLLLRAVYMLHE